MSYKISLLHATRGRSEKAKACRDLWLNSAENPNQIEHIFAIDDDDMDSLTNISSARVIVPRGKGCVQAWNAAAEKCTGDILIQLSDDWVPTKNWDTTILKEFEDQTGECVLAISDGHRTDDLLCMAILNRKRYDKQGFLFHPSFISVFSDDYFTWAAKKDGVLKNAKHIVFEHQHPIFGKAQMDATYQHSNSPDKFMQGHFTFNELTREANARICLAMIVKNEIKNMRKCLESVKDVIDYWVICDTGSTDGTQQLIKDLMAEFGIPGELHERPWVDFAYNRSESLALAKTKAEYTLVIDADDYLEFAGPTNVLRNMKQDMYHMKIIHGGLTYFRPQIVRNDFDWKYVGVLHEYLEAPKNARLAPPVMLNNVIVRASASDTRNGFSGSKKYLSDALVLEKALLADDLDPGLRTRYTFYQAQSYRDAGAHERSLAAYKDRVALGGWEEEVYYSMYMVARLKIILNYPEHEIVDALLKAWEYRPSRVDALYDLIRYLSDKGRYAFAYALATIGIKIPPCSDILFVREDIYQWRMLDDYAVLAMRTGNTQEAVKAANAIVNSPNAHIVPQEELNRIKNNLAAFNASLPKTK
jgi:glycosyltransferase involved in cell wall biosynthesis